MDNAFAGYQQMPNAFNQYPFNPMQMQPNMPFNPYQMQQPNMSFNPYQMQQPNMPQAPQTQIEEQDDEIEVVPKTQPKPSKKKNKKGKGKKEDAPGKQMQQWTKIEEEALAKAYINSSTSPIVDKILLFLYYYCNNQLSDSFWQETLDIFHGLMEQGEYRTIDSISSKWRKMNTLINRFCGFYNTTRANKPSGWNHENVFNEAVRLYENESKAPFPHVRAWLVVKDHPKWKGCQNEVAQAKRATKRSKSSESGSYSVGGSTGRCQININDEPDYEEEPIEDGERPPGRDKSKKIAAEKRKQAASGSGGGSRLEGVMVELKSFKEIFNDRQTEKRWMAEEATLELEAIIAKQSSILFIDVNIEEGKRMLYKQALDCNKGPNGD
ncbi:glutathione S-transferase T3-like [Helianthus annuus]|uniref:glutathione S-transferase T3-like n=1 Tax=Helianthus annuus TaxID=4232 RepID=UPI000B8F9C71|nr:glutathione S-transferase T3-like [Helianthus annuus]